MEGNCPNLWKSCEKTAVFRHTYYVCEIPGGPFFLFWGHVCICEIFPCVFLFYFGYPTFSMPRCNSVGTATSSGEDGTDPLMPGRWEVILLMVQKSHSQPPFGCFKETLVNNGIKQLPTTFTSLNWWVFFRISGYWINIDVIDVTSSNPFQNGLFKVQLLFGHY